MNSHFFQPSYAPRGGESTPDEIEAIADSEDYKKGKMNSTNDSSREDPKLSDSEKDQVLNEVAESIKAEEEFRAYLKAKKYKQAQSDS